MDLPTCTLSIIDPLAHYPLGETRDEDTQPLICVRLSTQDLDRPVSDGWYDVYAHFGCKLRDGIDCAGQTLLPPSHVLAQARNKQT